MGMTLPPVSGEAAAEAVAGLPERLRKRLDAAVGKAAGWPVARGEDGTVRVAVDAETTVVIVLSAGGTVTSAGAVTCSCLLAPACLHRAAVLAAAPLAEEGEPAAVTPEAVEAVAGGPEADSGSAPGDPGAEDSRPVPEGQRRAAEALWTAGVAALCAGAAAGALPRTRLLHAAHTARLAGLHRPAASAVRVARRLTEARNGDSAFRLGELTEDLAALLDEARTVREAPDAAAAKDAAGTARRTYEPAGSLRLYGLCTEPLVTASGYAGAATYVVESGPGGGLRSVAVVQPGGPERVVASAAARVPGGAALSLRQLGRGGGLIVTGATVTDDGRVGGGATVRSVAATGATWYEPPLDGLWARPVAEQVAAALAWRDTPADRRPSGADLLFLSGTVTSLDGLPALALDGSGDGSGRTVVLHAPDERPELTYSENLRVLARHPGASVRLVGRLAPDRPTGVTALALCAAATGSTPVDLGLDRLVPGRLGPADPAAAELGTPLPLPPVEWDLLSRTVARTVSGGRALTAAAADPALPARLRAVGLPTAAACAEALTGAARARRSDALGAMLPADPETFATVWLATALYVAAAARDFTTTAWADPAPR